MKEVVFVAQFPLLQERLLEDQEQVSVGRLPPPDGQRTSEAAVAPPPTVLRPTTAQARRHVPRDEQAEERDQGAGRAALHAGRAGRLQFVAQLHHQDVDDEIRPRRDLRLQRGPQDQQCHGEVNVNVEFNLMWVASDSFCQVVHLTVSLSKFILTKDRIL